MQYNVFCEKRRGWGQWRKREVGRWVGESRDRKGGKEVREIETGWGEGGTGWEHVGTCVHCVFVRVRSRVCACMRSRVTARTHI